jgi:hypothetical protein
MKVGVKDFDDDAKLKLIELKDPEVKRVSIENAQTEIPIHCMIHRYIPNFHVKNSNVNIVLPLNL